MTCANLSIKLLHLELEPPPGVTRRRGGHSNRNAESYLSESFSEILEMSEKHNNYQ